VGGGGRVPGATQHASFTFRFAKVGSGGGGTWGGRGKSGGGEVICINNLHLVFNSMYEPSIEKGEGESD